MADRYHSSQTMLMTAGAERGWTHGITVGGADTAPDEVIPVIESGASVGAVSVRITNKGTTTASAILDSETIPGSGGARTASVRYDSIYWHSHFGRTA